MPSAAPRNSPIEAATTGNSSRSATMEFVFDSSVVVEPRFEQRPADQAAEHRADRQIKPVGVDDANQPGLIARSGRRRGADSSAFRRISRPSGCAGRTGVMRMGSDTRSPCFGFGLVAAGGRRVGRLWLSVVVLAGEPVAAGWSAAGAAVDFASAAFLAAAACASAVGEARHVSGRRLAARASRSSSDSP